jgi:hypothetical protein
MRLRTKRTADVAAHRARDEKSSEEAETARADEEHGLADSDEAVPEARA